MRSPIAAIQESVGITNRFLILSGAATLLLAAGSDFLPRTEFHPPHPGALRIAGNVARLDFHDRYTRGGRDELADLGASINSMSVSLERTISDLKTANLAAHERHSAQNPAERGAAAPSPPMSPTS